MTFDMCLLTNSIWGRYYLGWVDGVVDDMMALKFLVWGFLCPGTDTAWLMGLWVTDTAGLTTVDILAHFLSITCFEYI